MKWCVACGTAEHAGGRYNRRMHDASEVRTRIVQSPSNRWVKSLRAALAHPPALPFEQPAGAEVELLAIEGFHLLIEALRSGIVPAAVFLRGGEETQALKTLETMLARYEISVDNSGGLLALSNACEFLVLPPELFASVVQTEAPQPIAALLPAPDGALRLSLDAPFPLLLVLAGIQDPGNVGTLLRSAEAFGATGALLLPGTASPWNSKCLRASAGSVLRLPLLAVRSPGKAAKLLQQHNIRSIAAVQSDAPAADALPLLEPSAFWIGSEGAGLGKAELAACESRVMIPMPGGVESLNAAVAGSLLLYEASRQRSASAPHAQQVKGHA
jgi:TrmH family RNA methyltransferase